MYFKTIYLLDLCILSYQLHAQTLIWPLDPYYECLIDEDQRKLVMARLHEWCVKRGDQRLHGPASCQGAEAEGWGTNNFLEPILSDYLHIYPWRLAFTRPYGRTENWVVYDTPSKITSRIGEVYMVHYRSGSGALSGAFYTGPYSNQRTINRNALIDVTAIHHVNPRPDPRTPARDLLYCFEGGTGACYGDTTAKGYAAWSLMGFVLAREVEGDPKAYDVYVVFRGSRSGKPIQEGKGLFGRAGTAYSGEGNPDWVTDLQVAWFLKKDPESVRMASVQQDLWRVLNPCFPLSFGVWEAFRRPRVARFPVISL